MTAPNLLNASNVTGRSTGLAVTTVNANVLSNATSSNTLVKINYLNICNSTTNSVTSNINLYKSGGTVYPLLGNVICAGQAALVAWGKDAAVYLEEGDTLQANCSANSAIVVTVSYEVIQ
jgi:hypothetical protein